MMADIVRAALGWELRVIEESGLLKDERIITSPQRMRIDVSTARNVLNLCANNYLGLSNHPEVVQAAKDGLERWGYGLSSVRFICGTQQIHKTLEARITEFLGTEDTILYSSCFDANTGLFETVLDERDAVVTDELNHASVIDGIRLCKAQRFRYRNNDLADLEEKLKQAAGCRFRMIATDGVFSMDGIVADLAAICALAARYDALVMVDDSHGVGVLGKRGKGTHEHCGVMGEIDVITGTLGKALGGASGGYTSGRKEIIDLLRQRSRPYLFSNSVPPAIVCGALKALEIVSASTSLRDRIEANAAFFREALSARGFSIRPGLHPIVPVMLGDAVVAQQVAARMLEEGVYVMGFSHPVVPHGAARVRVQVSAAHTKEDLSFACEKFAEVKRKLGL